MWRQRCTRSNVWVAEIASSDSGVRLADLRRVQELPGEGQPFDRLTRVLRTGSYSAAAIDAPFSVPAAHLPSGGHSALLKLVSILPRSQRRAFPTGTDLLSALRPGTTCGRGSKEYRATELEWIRAGVRTRSTMWAGPRGGAPMTAACLTLLAAAGRPLWPWTKGQVGVIAEAFPAAQLARWRLPRERYNGTSIQAARNREAILAGLRRRVQLPLESEEKMVQSADAIDAVLCTLGGIAITEDKLALPPNASATAEGWIAVHC